MCVHIFWKKTGTFLSCCPNSGLSSFKSRYFNISTWFHDTHFKNRNPGCLLAKMLSKMKQVLIINRLFDSFYVKMQPEIETCLQCQLWRRLRCFTSCSKLLRISVIRMYMNFNKDDVELLTSLYSYENIAFTNENHNNIKEPVGCILLLDIFDHILNIIKYF